jgi:tRNA U34 2-thiouridine synthase MnmA/TrmU
VIGVTLQLYDHGEAVRRAGSCCAGQDIYDAKQVADRLGIARGTAELKIDPHWRSVASVFTRISLLPARAEPSRGQ